MSGQYANMGGMVNRTAGKTASARVTESEYKRAVSAVKDIWTLPTLIRALIRAVGHAPERQQVFALLEPHRPKPGPVGRPRKRPAD